MVISPTPTVVAVPKLVPRRKLMAAHSQKQHTKNTWGRISRVPSRTK